MAFEHVPWRETRHRGIAVFFYRSDRSTGRTLALIRMAPGCGYPRHRHHGSEELRVLQGGYRDEHGEYLAGAFVRYEAGSEHSPVALPSADGQACVLLALAHEGVLQV